MAPTYPPIMLGTVLDVDTLAGGADAVFVECPTLAANRRLGPILTSVPGLAPGDSVIIATVGYARDAVQVIARTHSKFPGVDDIPNLRTELDGRLRREDATDLAARLDTASTTLGDQAEALALHDRRLNRLGADDDALRRSLATARANIAALTTTVGANATTASSGLAALRTERYGSADRTWRPRTEMRMTADIANLAAGTDYLLVGSFSSFRDTELANGKAAMLVIGTAAADPSRVIIPVDGEYDIEYAARTSPTSSGNIVIGCILNGNTANTVSSRVTTSSIFRAVGFASGEGTLAQLNRKAQLSAGDVLTFSIWSSVAFTLTAAYFGAVRTSVKVTRVGA